MLLISFAYSPCLTHTCMCICICKLHIMLYINIVHTMVYILDLLTHDKTLVERIIVFLMASCSSFENRKFLRNICALNF